MASNRKTPTFENNPKNPKYRPTRLTGPGLSVNGKVLPAGKGKAANLVQPLSQNANRSSLPRQGFNPFR